VVERNVANV